MNTELAGKVALVCGASKGLGKAAAHGLAAEGARVAICSRNAVTLENARQDIAERTEVEVVAIPADLRVPAEIEALVGRTLDAFGGLDILVTNAGGPKSGTFDTLSERDWQDAIELTLLSVVRLCQHAVPPIRKRGGGRIIHITSVAVKQPIEGLMLSNSLRAAVLGFSKTLATELAPEGILVNCVCPGFTQTDRVNELAEAAARREGVTKQDIHLRTVRSIPMQRMGEPRELADLIVFLASSRSSYITGTAIAVDGGYVRGLF